MSQAEIGNLRVRLGVDTAQFAAGLAQAQGSLGNFAGVLKKFAMVAGAALSFGAAIKYLKDTVNQMDDLGKAAQKIGIPVDQLSKLEYAAKLADVSLDDLSGTLAKFSKNISEVASGGKNDTGAALKALGISATDANGKLRPTLDLITDISEKFANMQDGAGKTALAIALFGKSGADMIPLLNGGRDAIEGAAKELEQFGGVVMPEASANAEAFNDNITRITEVGNGFATLIMSNMAPALAELTDNIVDFLRNSDTAKTIWEGLSWVIENSLQFLQESVAIWKTLAAYVGATGQAFSALKGGDFAGVSDALAQAGKLSEQAWADAEKQLNNYRAALYSNSGAGAPGKGSLPGTQADIEQNGIGTKSAPPIIKNLGDVAGASKSATDALEKLKAEGQQVWDSTRTPIESYQLAVQRLDDLLKKHVITQDTYNRAVQQLRDNFAQTAPATNEFAQKLEDVSSAITGSLSSALSGLISGTESVSDAFSQMADSILNSLSDIVAGMITSGLQSLLLGSASPSQADGGLLGKLISGARAGGGSVYGGQTYLVGENGPELFTSNTSGRIVPNNKLSGGSNVQVVVNNNSGQQVSTNESTDGRGNRRVEVTVGEMVATEIRRTGSSTNMAIRNSFRAAPALTGR